MKVYINGQVPKVGGTITLKDGEVISNTLEFESGVKEENSKKSIGKAVTEDNKTVAGNIPQGNYEPGDEYVINVDGTNEYHFYVLSTDGDIVSLIMSNNIYQDGSIATTKINSQVAWNSSGNGLNTLGPVTVMNYLYNATKNWVNIRNIQMNYTDEGNQYEGIKTNENITTITKKDQTETANYENLKARLPKLSEIEVVGCTSNTSSCPSWIVNGLTASGLYPAGIGENISEIYKYWILSSDASSQYVSPTVTYEGTISSANSYKSDAGVRPVIEILKSDLQ